MHTLLWGLQWILAVGFAVTGLGKLVRPLAAMADDPHTAWVDDVPNSIVRLAGATELVAAIALVVPGLMGVAEVLTPAAGIGLAIQMALAALWVNAPRRDRQGVVLTAVLGVLALAVGIGRLLEPLG